VSDFESEWRALVSGETRCWWAGPARGGLAILAGVYGGVVQTYRAGFDVGLLRARRLACPVVAVGNITVGGTGKTTTVRWLVQRLLEWDRRPAVLSYGYRAGRKDDADPVTVVSGPEGIREPVGVSGDEPQLLARSLPGVPVLAGRKRVLSGQRAVEAFNVDVCVLDDAFQYWRLEKDLEIVLVNAANPFGYGRMLPRGMLREPVRALRRAHAVVLTHADRVSEGERSRLADQLLRQNAGLVLAEARHRPLALRDYAGGEPLSLEGLAGGRWAALSSLGQPESFEETLRDLGAGDVIPARFPDHHPYTAVDLAAVLKRVRQEGVDGIVTTEKDAVKIQPEWLDGAPLRVVEIGLEFLTGQDDLERLTRARIESRSRTSGA